MSSKLQELREVIIKAVPEILEICGGEDSQHFCPNCNNKVGGEIRLSDILVAVNKVGLPDEYLFFDANWIGYLRLSGAFGEKAVKYNYKDDNLQHQSPECIDFLHSLIIKK